MTSWSVRSAYHAQSNGRAEAGVKTVKRMLTSNTGPGGKIDTERVAAGLLQYRNTPDPASGLSPSQILFGRNLRDLLPVAPNTQVFESENVQAAWRDAWRHQEEAMRVRFAKQMDTLTPGSREHVQLAPGDRVLVQNQVGAKPKRWDRSGVVVEVKPHGQHLVRVDGSRRVTLRNRQFLRKVEQLQAADRGSAPEPTPASAGPTPSPPAGCTPQPRQPSEVPQVNTEVTQPDEQLVLPTAPCRGAVERAPPVSEDAPERAAAPAPESPIVRRSTRVSAPPERLNMQWNGPSYVSGLSRGDGTGWPLA